MSGKRRAGERPRWIAEESVVFVRPDGARVPGRILVGEPETLTAEEARCPVALEGLGERVWWIHGGSTLQALALGVRFLHASLQAEREHGLRVCLEESRGRLVDAPLDALLAGTGDGQGGKPAKKRRSRASATRGG